MATSHVLLVLVFCGLVIAAEQPSFLFILVDDMGWTDFTYNQGVAATPNIDAIANGPNTIKMLDFHSGKWFLAFYSAV
jgi:hypothetical protein